MVDDGPAEQGPPRPKTLRLPPVKELETFNVNVVVPIPDTSVVPDGSVHI
jgi:hypothetical protein